MGTPETTCYRDVSSTEGPQPSLPPDKFLFIHESRRRHSCAEYETSCNCEGVQATHLSSTSWNTQLGVCVVVKIRLSGGILGAVEIEGREMNRPAKQLNNQFSSNIHSVTLLTSVTDTLSVPYRASWSSSHEVTIYPISHPRRRQVNASGCRPHLRIQSAPAQPAGGSRTALQTIQHPELSSGRGSYGKDSTEDPLHAPSRHCNTDTDN